MARLSVTAPGPLPLQLDGSAVHQRGIEPDAEGTTYTFSVIAGGLSVLVPRTYDGALFSDESAGGRQARPQGKSAKRWVRVLAVGVDTITAARVKDGRVITVVRGPKISARDAAGTKRPWSAFLGGLTPGDLLRVEGQRQKRRGRIRARRVRLHSPSPGG